LKAGRASVTLSQPGDDFYNPAPSVGKSFCINPPKPIITTLLTSSGVVLTSSSDIGNHWYKSGSEINNATLKNFTPKENGVYTVAVLADDCPSEHSDDQVVTITGLNDEIYNLIKVYPNPATSELFVEMPSSAADVQVKIVDLLGRTIETRLSNSSSAERFELAHLKPSMYIVRITYEGRVLSKMFVKQ
jgi:hypothetical protein